MKRSFAVWIFFLLALSPAFAVTRVNLLQLNDVYEISPLAGGKVGGLARIATLRKRLALQNPNTMAVLAGDFLSPSAMGLAQVDGVPLNGRQTVDTLNRAGLDLAIFGNHEFDIPATALQARVSEACFLWLSGNITTLEGSPLLSLPHSAIRAFSNPQGEVVRIGFVSATVDKLKAGPWKVQPFLKSLRSQVDSLKNKVDAIVAVTHLRLPEDIEVAKAFPEISLVIGGHEHDNYLVRRGAKLTPIAKADSNAKSVYIHELFIDPTVKKVNVQSHYFPVTDLVPEDPAVKAVADGWEKKASEAFRAQGFEPKRVITESEIALDGMEARVRSERTALTELVGKALLSNIPGAQASIYNGSTIRLDDIIPAGPITEYDVLKILPLPDHGVGVTAKGSVLIELAASNATKAGTGSFLQFENISTDQAGCFFTDTGQRIEPDSSYFIAVNDFMVNYLAKIGKLDRSSVVEGRDSRHALIDYLQKAR